MLEICESRCGNWPRGFSGCSTVSPPLVKEKHDPFSKGNHYASWLKSDINSLTFFWHLELKQTGATLSHCIIYAVHLASSTPKIFRSPHVYCSATLRVVHFMVSWTVNALVFLVNICVATICKVTYGTLSYPLITVVLTKNATRSFSHVNRRPLFHLLVSAI